MEEEYLNIGGIYSPRGMRGLTRQDYLDWEIKNALVLQDNQIPEEQWEDYFVTSKMLKFFPENDKTFWNGYTLDLQVQIYNNRVLELADAFNARTYAPNEVKERDESGQFITEDDFKTTRDREEVNIEDPDDLEYLAKVGLYGIYESIFGQRNTYKSAEDINKFNGVGGNVSMAGLLHEYDRLLHKSYSTQEQDFMNQFKLNVEGTEDPQKTKDQLRTEIQSVAQQTSPYYRYYFKKLEDAYTDNFKKNQESLLNPNDNLLKLQNSATSKELARWQSTFTDLDWDEMAQQFAVDSKLHGQDYAVRHLNERIQDAVDDKITFVEKMEKGVVGGNVYQTAGALILGIGLLAGIISDLNPENRDENLSAWLNLWYNIVNNKITQYGSDVSQYGAFAPNKIDEWKEIGIGRYLITTQSSLDYGGFADQVFNENFIPTAFSQVGFTNAAALESRLFSWAGKGVSKALGKKALKSTAKRVAQAADAALELSGAAKKGFLNTWDTWAVPAFTSLMESQAEAVEVSKNVLTQGDLLLDALKNKDFLEAFRNEYNTQFQKIKEYYMQQPYANNSNLGVYARVSLGDGSTRYEYLKPKEEWAEELAANYLNQTENLQAITDNVRNLLDGKYKPYESEIKAEAAKAAWGTFYRNFGVLFVLNTTLEKAIQAPSVRARLDEVEKGIFRKFDAKGTPGNMKVSSRYTRGRQVWDIAKVELGEAIEEYWQTINEEAGAAKGQYNIEKYIDNMYNGDQMMEIGDNAAGATKKFWLAAGETAISSQALIAAAYGGFGAMLGTAKFNGYRTVMRNPDGSIVTDEKGNPIMGFGRTYKEDGKRESIWDVMVRWFPWETGIGRDIRYTNLKKKGLQEEADRIQTFFNNPDNADKLKDDLAALEFAKKVAEEDLDELDLATSANGQYVAMWNYLEKIKGTSAYNQMKSKLDILSGEAAREEIGEAESERLINSYVEHMKKGEDREENQDKSVEQLRLLLRENAKTIKDKFDKVSKYSKFVEKNFGLIDNDVKKALVWGYMNIDDAKAQLDDVTKIINSTKWGTTGTLSTVREDVREDYAKYVASKRGIERVEETLQRYIEKRDLAKQKLENVKENSNRKSRNSIKLEIKAWDEVIEKQQKALNKLKKDVHYSEIEELIERGKDKKNKDNPVVLSAEDIMQLDPESRWLLINNAKEYSKEQLDEIKKLMKVNNPEAFKRHLQQSALAYSAIRQITDNIIKAASDPDYYDRYVLQVKTLALYNTSRNVIKKINEIPDYDDFVKALNETMELAKNKPEALYYQMELSRLANNKEGSEHLKRYMREQKKLSEVIDVLLKDNVVKLNSDLNERTLLGLFWLFMTNEKKVDVDLVTDKDVKDHFDEFRAYVLKWNSEQDELNKVSLDVYSDPITSLQSAFAVAKDSYQAVLDDKKMKEEIPLTDSDAGLNLDGFKREPLQTSRESLQGKEEAILIESFFDSAMRLARKGINIMVEDNQEEKLQTLDNEQRNQLMDIIKESVENVETLMDVIMNLLGYLNTTSDDSIRKALNLIIRLANETTPESLRHSPEPLSDTAISTMDMVTVLSTKAPSGSIDSWVQQTYLGVEEYLRNNNISSKNVFYLVSHEVSIIDRKQTDKSKKLNEDTLPIMMCVMDNNGKFKDADGNKYQVVGFLPYGDSKTSKNMEGIAQIRKMAFEQYNRGITDGCSHPVLDENGKKLFSACERLDVDIPYNGHTGNTMKKFALNKVLLKVSGSSSFSDSRFKQLVKKMVKGIVRTSLREGHYMLVYQSTKAGNNVYLFVKKVSDTVNKRNQNLASVINEAVTNNFFGVEILKSFNSLTYGIYNQLTKLQNIYSENKNNTTIEEKDNNAVKLLNEQMANFVNWPKGWNFAIKEAGNRRVVVLESQDPLASFNGLIELMQFNALDVTTLDDEAFKSFITNLFTENKDGKYVIRQATPLERIVDAVGTQNDFIIWQINYNEAERDTLEAAERMENYLKDDLLEINQDFLDVQIHGVSVSSPFQSSDKPQVKELGDTSEVKPSNNKNALELMKESALQKLGLLRRGTKLAKDESCYVDGSKKEYSRVTSLVSDFDLDSPYALPSTTIGNVFDSFVRDFFSGELILNKGKIKRADDTPLKYLYPNTSEEELTALAELLDTLRTQLLADGITILTPEKGELFTVAGRIVVGNEERDVAGTMDLVGIDSYGRLHIFDMKTFRVLNVNDDSEIKKAIAERELKWKKQLTLYTRLVSLEINDNQPFEVASINIIPIAVSYPAPSQDNEYRVENHQLYYNSRPITNTSPKLIASKMNVGTEISERFYLRENEVTNEESSIVPDQIEKELKSCLDTEGGSSKIHKNPGDDLDFDITSDDFD